MSERVERDVQGSEGRSKAGGLGELARLFLKLGAIAFGGPAAHIAMMQDEVVKRRRWLTHEEFIDLIGATNLIPGPNSTEMAIHVGLLRGGWKGLIVAGTCFILPAMLIVWALAWVYVAYGSLPEVTWLLYGIKPVIIAVVIQALWALGKTAVKGPLTGFVGLAVVVLFFLGWNEILLLFAAGFGVMAVQNLRRGWKSGNFGSLGISPIALFVPEVAAGALAGAATTPISLLQLMLFFSKSAPFFLGAVMCSLHFSAPTSLNDGGG